MKLKLSLIALCAFVSVSAFAASYVVPPDDVFIQKSDTIVLARAVSSAVRETPETGIETVYRFAVGETLKGDARTEFEIHIPGGGIDGHYKMIVGAPVFDAGTEYLLFLRDATATTQHLTDFGLGVFVFSDDGSRRTVKRGGEVYGWDVSGRTHRESVRDAEAFLSYVREVGRGAHPAANYVVTSRTAATESVRPPAKIEATFNGSGYTANMGTAAGCPAAGCGGRWTAFPVNWNIDGTGEPGAPGTPAGKTALSAAFGAWNSSGNGISYVVATSNTNTNGILEASDHINNITFEKNLSSVGAGPYSCAGGGVLGLGGIQIASGTNTKNGEQYFTTNEVDVSMNAGIANCTTLFTSGNFTTAVTHEVGHTLGFRHSDQTRADNPSIACSSDPTLECSSSAVMRSSVPNGLNGALQTWDQHAAAGVYGSGVSTCTAPQITTQPQNASISTPGTAATLSVVATGTAPLTYQWYLGTTGDVSNPVANGTTASIQVNPGATAQYWVRVTGQCAPNADSTTATVTVSTNCAAPQITAFSQNTSINAGASTQLSVTATGTGTLNYQWYTGTSGNTANPITGANSSTLNVSPASTTSYWVHVGSSCNATGSNSTTVVVTVITNGCAPITIISQPQSKVITQGQSASLTFNVSTTATPVTYQWYIGTPPDRTAPIAGATSATLTVSPAQTTIYWALATNSCANSINSFAAQVTVNPPGCPTITMATPTVTQSGNTYTLAANPSGGTGLTVTWSIQQSGGTLQQIGTGLSINVTPAATTTYVATAKNSCGATLDVPVTITINSVACTAPTLTQPLDVTIVPGASATLTVAATGTGTLHYQWYQGPPPSTSTQVGSDSATLITGPLGTMTQYWVKVTNDCGSNQTASANSSVITVTTQVARRRAAHH